VAIDVEVRLVAMHPLSDRIGHPAKREDVAGTIESEGIVCIKPFTCRHLRINGPQAFIVGLKGMGLASDLHRFDDIAPTVAKGSSSLVL
jgi:hypothetical protein